MRTYGLRNDNDNGSLINYHNYTAANCLAIPSIVQVSPKTSLEAIPFYYLAWDLTTNGLGSGLDLNGSPLILSTEAAAGTSNLYCDAFIQYSAVLVAQDPSHLSINY